MRKRVVITGIGPVSSIGIGKKEFFNNLLEMKTNIQEVPHCYEKNYNFKSKYLVPKPKFSIEEFDIPSSIGGLMEDSAKFSVLCAKLALEDAGFTIDKKEPYFEVKGLQDCSVIMGVGLSSLQTGFEAFLAHTSEKEKMEKEKLRFNRMVIPMMMPNSVSSWVSILFKLKNLNFTINAACASGSFAIGEAYKHIAEGRCSTAIAGGVEVLGDKDGVAMRGFDMLTTLTKSKNGKPMPFSKNRSGFLFNEGAGCALVLEGLEEAQKRGANIYAEIVGYECSSDAYNIVQMEPSGQNIKELFNKIIQNKKIDYLNAHGTATIQNDEIEAKAIQDFFGNKDTQPIINSTKGIVGHSIGASGAIEMAVTAMSLKESKIHGNLTVNPIENLNIPLNSMEAKIKHALSTSYGFGGHNAMILLKKVNENE